MYYSLGTQNDSILINCIHLIIVFYMLYYNLLTSIIILSLLCLIDYGIRCNLKQKSPVKVDTICLGYSTNGWFILTIFSQLLKELTKITVIAGILTIIVQYLNYPGKPTKQRKYDTTKKKVRYFILLSLINLIKPINPINK